MVRLCFGVAEARARHRQLWFGRETYTFRHVRRTEEEPLRHHLRRVSQSCGLRCQLYECWEDTTEDSGVDQQQLHNQRTAQPRRCAFLVVSEWLLRASS